jgi:hypothetical protein
MAFAQIDTSRNSAVLPHGRLIRETLVVVFILAALVTSTRLMAAYGLQILPDPVHLETAYQHLAIRQLHDDLSGALLNLHSQPPLWNFFLGVVAKACAAEAPCMIQLIWQVHVVLTVATATTLYVSLRLLTCSIRMAVLLALSYALTPAAFYYENFIQYAHVTAAFFAFSSLAVLLLLKTGKSRYFALFCAFLVILSLIWTLFHPIYILLVGGLLLAKAGATPLRVSILALTLAVALLPSVKNKMVFGIFSSGSWLGLNVSQVAPSPVEGCSFKTFAETHDLIGVHIGTALNDPRMIPYSKDCLKRSLDVISDQPLAYVSGAVVRTATSLSLWPNEYLFPPLNWDRFPKIPDTYRELTADNLIIIPPSLSRFLTLALNLFALIALAELARRAPTQTQRAFFQVMLLSVVLFLGLAHAVNGPEQERMRYTLHPLFWGLYSVVAIEAVSRLRRWTKH